MMLHLVSRAGTLHVCKDHTCHRRLRVHRLSLRTGFIEPRLQG